MICPLSDNRGGINNEDGTASLVFAMTSALRRFGAITQILSVLVFAVMSAQMSPICAGHEASRITPALERDASLESKVVPSPGVLANVVALPIPQQNSSSYSVAPDTSNPLQHRFHRPILRR